MNLESDNNMYRNQEYLGNSPLNLVYLVLELQHDHLDIVAKDVARSQWKLDDARDSYTVPRHLCDLAGIISAPPRPSARPLQ